MFKEKGEFGVFRKVKQGFTQAILMSGSQQKKLNLLIEFSNSIVI